MLVLKSKLVSINNMKSLARIFRFHVKTREASFSTFGGMSRVVSSGSINVTVFGIVGDDAEAILEIERIIMKRSRPVRIKSQIIKEIKILLGLSVLTPLVDPYRSTLFKGLVREH